LGRQAKGVRLIRLDEGQELSSAVSFEGDSQDDDTGDNQSNDSSSNKPTRSMQDYGDGQEYLFDGQSIEQDILEEGMTEGSREYSHTEESTQDSEISMNVDDEDSFFKF